MLFCIRKICLPEADCLTAVVSSLQAPSSRSDATSRAGVVGSWHVEEERLTAICIVACSLAVGAHLLKAGSVTLAAVEEDGRETLKVADVAAHLKSVVDESDAETRVEVMAVESRAILALEDQASGGGAGKRQSERNERESELHYGC